LTLPLPEPTTATVDIAAVYDEHVRLLVGTAISRFGISESDAETLAHDVFLAYMLKADEIRDRRAWLLGSICNATKAFLRSRARTEALGDAISETPDPAGDLAMPQMLARECLACLTPRCQLALRLRYIEGYTVPEIACELETTAKYAQKLVSRCLQQASARYGVRT
jgi:RNA polymerase sigma-70 factor (ECF subfamily)